MNFKNERMINCSDLVEEYTKAVKQKDYIGFINKLKELLMGKYGRYIHDEEIEAFVMALNLFHLNAGRIP